MRTEFCFTAALGIAVLAACSSNSSGTGGATSGQAGQSCTAASQCYPSLDAGSLRGTVDCLTQVTGGYCTHTCQTDADCCAVPGECASGLTEVCAPFESTGTSYCFLSCAATSIPASAGTTDATVYCQKFASASFTCRSTGGGKNNQQICAP